MLYNKITKMNRIDLPHSALLYQQTKTIELLLNQSLFHKNVCEISGTELSKVKRCVTELLIKYKTMEEMISRKDNTIAELEKEIESKDSIIQFLDSAKKEIQQFVQQIVGYNQHYLQIIKRKDQQIQELFEKMDNSSIQQVENVYHYDIENDLNTNLVQWDTINEKQKKTKEAQLIASKMLRQNKQNSKKSILEDVKKYITNTQQKFRKTDRYSLDANKYDFHHTF